MKLIIEYTFDENEWADYSDVCPELVLEDMFNLDGNLKDGIECRIIEAEGFYTGGDDDE